jgi:peptide/nickel transport system permease protein
VTATLEPDLGLRLPSSRRAPRLARFFATRVALGALTIFLVSIIVFGATQLLPGDAARAILGRDVTPDRLATVRQQLHLNGSIFSQYWHWISGVLTGDLGTSISAQQPVTKVLGSRIANSGVLVGLAALIAFPLSIIVGAAAGYWRDTIVDHVNSIVSVVVAALPDFVIAITLVLVFSTNVFHVLPAVSLIDSGTPIWHQLKQLILPVLALVLYEAPYVSRIMRASTIEVLESDYIEMARLKGLPEWKVVARHALPNAIVPTIQVIAVQLAVLIGGVVAIEFVFAFPGIGQELVSAVANRDVPVVQAIALLIAGGYVVVNLLADALTILISPRLRTSLD